MIRNVEAEKWGGAAQHHCGALDFRSEFEAIATLLLLLPTPAEPHHTQPLHVPPFVFYAVHAVNAVEIFTSMDGLRAKRAACLFRIHPGLFRIEAGLFKTRADRASRLFESTELSIMIDSSVVKPV